MTKKATLGQISQFTAMCDAGIYDRAFVQAIIDRRVELIDRQEPDLITVPEDATSESLIASVEALGLNYLNDGYASWDFLRDEAGKTFEVLVWKPGRPVSSEEVRAHFKGLKADGNVPAFLAWVASNDPRGWYLTIPSEDERLFLNPDGNRCVPYFYRDHGSRWLSLYWLAGEWDDDYSLVAFREVEQPA